MGGSCEEEAKTLVKLGRHPDLVRYFGLCTEGPEHLLLTELAPYGSLDHFLETHEGQVTLPHKLKMLEQICAGMIAIVSWALIHRDLATRNILVFAFDASNPAATRVKITDFGLSVDRHYQTHAYGAQNEDVPFRWMPPEALRKRRFSEKSDVWAFGVTAWELLTGGEVPYGFIASAGMSFEGSGCMHALRFLLLAISPAQSMTHTSSFSYDMYASFIASTEAVAERVCGGERLTRPGECPEALWALLQRTWAERPADRPTFVEVAGSLVDLCSALAPQPTALLGAGAAAQGHGARQEAAEGAPGGAGARVAREFERSLAALERQRDVDSIVRGMQQFAADESVQKAACQALLKLTPSVEGDEWQRIRRQEGEAWAQMLREYRAMESAGVLDVVFPAISKQSPEVASAGCRILRLLARDDQTCRKIGAQVVQSQTP